MRAKLILSVVTASILYLAGPFVAGLLRIGDREGPRIYSSEYHEFLYIISYEMVRDEKPRMNIETSVEPPDLLWIHANVSGPLRAAHANTNCYFRSLLVLLTLIWFCDEGISHRLHGFIRNPSV